MNSLISHAHASVPRWARSSQALIASGGVECSRTRPSRVRSEGRATIATLALILGLAAIPVGPGEVRVQATSWDGTRLAMVPGVGLTQPPTSQPKPAAGTPAASAPGSATAAAAVDETWLNDLTTRYRFREESTANPSAEAAQGELPAYRVASRETIRTESTVTGGVPKVEEQTWQMIFTERPASVNAFREINGVVRRYDAVRIAPAPKTDATSKEPALLQGLELWCQQRAAEGPMVLCLTPQRELREREFLMAASQVFVPALANIMPVLPARVGDTWKINPGSASALVGTAIGNNSALVGQLLEVRLPPKGVTAMGQALVKVSGRVTTPLGTPVIHAQVKYRFATLDDAAAASPAPAVSKDQPKEPATAKESVEAKTSPADGAVSTVHGSVTQVTLAQSMVLADAAKRLAITRQLVLERQSASEAKVANPPAIPNPAPRPTPANSWLVYVDPDKLFTLRHPQDLRVRPLNDYGTVELIRPRGDAPDVVTLRPAPRTQLNPDELRQGRAEVWRDEGLEAIPGTAGYLPEAQWPGVRAYRFEAVLKATGPTAAKSPRIHFGGYVLQFTQNASLYVEATSTQDNPAAFRDEVEAMLKTFRFSAS